MSALLFGVRRAVLVRRSLEAAAAAAAEHPAERLPVTQPAAITGTITTVSERAGGASGGRPPAEAQRGASGGRPPAGAERGASGGRPPAETQRRASARRREGAGQR
jgi:hypothetical protein